MTVSPFERDLVARALNHAGPSLAPGTSIVMMPDTKAFNRVRESAVHPALFDCGFRSSPAEPAFDSRSFLSDVARVISSAEIIIADLTGLNADIMYALGLAHGLARCPLIITQEADELPFNLDSMRRIVYHADEVGLFSLREDLARAVRNFLASAEASRTPRPPRGNE